MIDSPFGIYGNEYDEGYEEFQEEQERLAALRAEIYSADSSLSLMPDSDDDEDFEFAGCTGLTESSVPQNWQQSALGKGFGKRARFLSVLVDQVVEAGNLLLADGGKAFSYEKDGGYFQPVDDLQEYLSNFFLPETARSLLSTDLDEVEKRLSWVKGIRCKLDEYNCRPEMVNPENGVFNWKTSEFLSHNPRFRFTYQINAKYLEDSDDICCHTFDKFCETSLEGDPLKRQLLLEFIGYICTNTNDGKCAMFFKGQPNSGKSVISSFVSKLFAPELVSSIPLHQLGDRFFRAELAGKKLNVAGEIAGRALRDISIFKSVTGNDRIAGEFKRGDPFYFTSPCKLLFSGNTLPLTTEVDATAAFVNRIRVLLFNTSVPVEEQDKRLLEKLWGERDSIVTLALHAAHELMKRNFEFAQPEDSKKFLASFAMRGNVIQSFIEDCCILAPNARTFNTELYEAFATYCMQNGLERFLREKFYNWLSGIPYVTAKRIRIGKENRQGHVGIALKKEMDNLGTLEQ